MSKQKLIDLIDETDLSNEQLETLITLVKSIKKVDLNGIVLLYDNEKNRIVFIDQEDYSVVTYDLNNQIELSSLIQDLTLTGSNDQGDEYNVLKTSGKKLALKITDIDKLIARLIYDFQYVKYDPNYIYEKKDMVDDIFKLIKKYRKYIKSKKE